MNKIIILVSLIVLLFSASTSYSKKESSNTFVGTVVEVHDGDTIKAIIDCNNCPDLFRTWLIRVLNIDTPEIHSKCDRLRNLAQMAKSTTAGVCPVGTVVTLNGVHFDKFGGRLDAHVTCINGDPAKILTEKGLARPFYGIGSKPWSEEKNCR